MLSLNQIRSAFTIQAINTFVTGVIYVLLPLLMLDKGISIESIGLIFAALPLVMQANRLLFGIVSDFIGRKKFFWLNGLMNLSFLSVYYFATTPLGFLLGKIGEGIRNASLWSVNRAYIMDHAKEKEKAIVKMRGISSIFNALGTLLAGFLLTMLFYDKTLILLLCVSVLIFPNVLMLKERRKRKLEMRSILGALDFRHKSKKFKNFMVIFFLIGLSFGFIVGYILPLFLRTAEMKVENIGLLLGVRTLFNGIILYIFHSIWSGRRKIIVGGLLTSLLIALIPFSTYTLLPLLIVSLGIVSGISDAGYETIFASITDYDTLGRDIGILMIGIHVGITISQAVSGFIITAFGFKAIFLISGALFAISSLATYHNL